MTSNCFSCNAAVPTANSSINIFGRNLILQSKRKLDEVISEIINKPLTKGAIHSQVLCRKCFTAVTEYDSLQIRLQVIKNDFTSELKNTLPKHNLNYDTYCQSPVKPARVVLPASKLQPVPANFMLDIAKMAAVTKSGMLSTAASSAVLPGLFKVTTTTAKPSINLKVTVGSTVLTQTLSSGITTSRPKIPLSTTNSITSPSKDYTFSMNQNRTARKNPVMSFNVNSLPKELLSSAVGKIEKSEIKEDVENNGEQSMEIDEDCTFAVAVATDEDGKIVFEDAGQESENNGKFILDKLKLLDDDEEATIIHMGSGQRVMYDGKKISLVQASDNDENDGNDNDDSLDSNEEARIELQVSGDEEIANALINAAQGQGGAFIKVESGEMYRVESIKSNVKSDNDTSHLQNIVERESDDSNIYKCLLCQLNKKKVDPVKGNAEIIMAHLKKEHNARAYICLMCGVVVRKRAEYTAHLETHANKDKAIINKTKVHQCTECQKKFPSRNMLNEHMNVHAGNRPYVCSTCGKTYASKYTYQAHLKTHSTRPRPFKCKQCMKSFFTQQNLTQHEKTHSGLKEFICTVCNKAFATQHNLEVHGVIHTGVKPYSCPACHKSFARRAEIRDHMRIHTGERPFACDICGATFTQRSNLHSHKRATHLDDKRHMCTQCPKKFKRRRLLDYHLKAAHTGERPLQCNICRATFVYPEHYKKHARIHSGEKPYVCEVCGKSFNSRDNRNMHRFVHSDKKPYECLTCGAGYMRKQVLYAHMNTTGHVAESIVVNQPRVFKTLENGIPAPVIVVSGMQMKTDNLTNNTLEDTEELEELDENPEGDVDPSINGEDTNLLSIHNLNGLIEATVDDKLDDQQIITTDDKGNTMQLIQIQLADGNTGWVAINHHEDMDDG